MTIPHFGKREPGGLTASSPGDTLHFAFGSYNDSGDSEALSGFAVTDIEVFKNGDPTTRATDSGYSLISDTGQVGDRVGLYRFSVQLFNTADDTGHYQVGAWYQVAVDSVTVDGKTVRFWVGSFEIGRPRVDVRELIGDTGAANWLKQTFAAGFADTGVNERLARIQSDVDTGLRVHIDDSDTGLKDTIADLDTGIRAILQTSGVNVKAFWGDTGAASNIRYTTAAIARGTVDVGASTTSIPTSAFTPAGAAADQFKGRIVTFDRDTTTAALRGQSTDITASSNAATPTLTVTALTTAPSSGDTFSVT